MARLARHHSPQTIVELGSSLGISAAYLATGSPGSKVITIEGDRMVGAKAIGIFNTLGIKNIELINDTFESVLTSRIQSIGQIDLLFLDGNHRKEALLSYYHMLKKQCHENTIIIVDDIYWSAEMTSAWTEIIREKEITQSVDCFQFGLLFFSRHFLAKENHLIRLPLKAFMRN
jgi:predicted O-methyltransferase YrrM